MDQRTDRGVTLGSLPGAVRQRIKVLFGREFSDDALVGVGGFPGPGTRQRRGGSKSHVTPARRKQRRAQWRALFLRWLRAEEQRMARAGTPMTIVQRERLKAAGLRGWKGDNKAHCGRGVRIKVPRGY